MSDDAKNPATSLQDLLKTRESLITEFNAKKDALSAVDVQIAANKAAQAKAQQEAALQTLVPGDKNTLKGHDIQFLLSYTKEGATLTGAGVTAAHQVSSLAKASGVEGVNVAARFWGKEDAYLQPVKLDSQFGATAYNPPRTMARNFLPATLAILTESAADNAGQKNYVIVSDGSFTNDVASTARRLKAAAELNPKATFDFLVLNKADTKVDELVQKLKEAGVGSQVNLVKVGTTQEITAAAKNVLKARLAAGGTQPAANKPAAAPAP